MVQIQSTKGALRISKIPPTAVGGWFRSSQRNKAIRTQSNAISATCTSEETKAGSEQPPNSRWGDLRAFLRMSWCRKDLNHPPTAVGGIPRALTQYSKATV